MPGPRTWARRRPRCCASSRAPISTVIERCSGHGGSWGVRKENFEIALKVGKPVARHGEGVRQAPCRLGMPAGRRPYPPGHRDARAARRRRARRIPSKSSPAPTEPEHGPQDRRHPTSCPPPTMPAAARSCAQAVVALKRRAAHGGRARSPRCISRASRPCACRSRRCCISRRAGRSSWPASSRPITRWCPTGASWWRRCCSRSTIPCAGPISSPASAASSRRPSSRSAARRSAACRRPIRTAPPPKARPPRCSSSISPSRAAQIARFKQPGERVIVGFDHPVYAHMSVMPEPVRQALGGDFD